MALKDLAPIRHRTYFGSGAHCLCAAKARRTGMQCQRVANKGRKFCQAHGGAIAKAKGRDKPVISPERAERRYMCSIPFSEEARVLLEANPRLVRELMTIRSLSERGRKIHEALNAERDKY